MAHTPGPWRFQRDGDEPYWGVDMPRSDGVGYGSGNAMVYTSRDDAALIAAAPDLLAALKVWMELETTCDGRRPCYCEDPEITKHGKCYACMAVDAIAKAEGRAE